MSTHGGYDYGLEDKLLRKNIPGRYSSWEKDADEEGPKARCEWIDSEDGDEEDELLQHTPQVTTNSMPTQGHGTAGTHTGPKGVLKDYKEHQRIEQHNKEITRMENEEKYRREAYGATRVGAFPTIHDHHEEDEEDDEQQQQQQALTQEDYELKLLRQQRLADMQATVGMPVFGQVKEVAALEFLEEIEKEDPRVMVIVHIYDESNLSCRKMNTAIGNLAKGYSHAKFLRMPVSEAPAGSAFDEDTLPVLVAYRGGELVDSLIRCTDSMSLSATSISSSGRPSSTFSTSDVEWLLNEHGLLEQFSVITASNSEVSEKQRHTSHQLASSDISTSVTHMVYRYDSDGCGDDSDGEYHDLGVD